ncbi:MAG TPA: 30S ribosomal protein S17 [Candidatus Saccharimonadales bacterium]|nr:30S ribosomal protein S17 [Candidatus Saccharimonadales bacterium]
MSASNTKKTILGTVVSDKMQGSAVVEVVSWKIDRIIRKRFKKNRKFIVENPDNQYHTGDKVKIVETRPLSRHKRFTITEKI